MQSHNQARLFFATLLSCLAAGPQAKNKETRDALASTSRAAPVLAVWCCPSWQQASGQTRLQFIF
jgi:hypothetical protein